MNKKLNFITSLFMAALICVGCSKEPADDEPEEPVVAECEHKCEVCGKCIEEGSTLEACADKCTCAGKKGFKHLITDSNGDYGGTLDKTSYGEGTPFNGEFDNEDTIYYPIHDWYNLKSTETRTMITNFAPYQQTMANSDGVACALMILNNEGEDVYKKYTEEKLVAKVESACGIDVAANGTSADDLTELFTKLGYVVDDKNSKAGFCTSYQDFTDLVLDSFAHDRYLMVRYQDGMLPKWHIVVGIDTMGTEDSPVDDVLIFADPFDAADHYQDGFSVYHQERMYHWWKVITCNVGSGTGTTKSTQDLVLVKSKKGLNIVKDTVDPLYDPELKEHTVAPYNMLTNLDGTCGGQYGDGRYSATRCNGGSVGFDPTVRENLGFIDYTYYSYNDYTRMEDTDSLRICTGYRPFKQTMASSCGICSTMTTLQYYGFDWSTVGQYITRTDFYGYDSVTKPTFGGVNEDDNGRKQEAIVCIYAQGDSTFSAKDALYHPGKESKDSTFYSYGGVGASKLSYVSKTLGYTPSYNSKKKFGTMKEFHDQAYTWLNKHEPTQISWNPTGGHWEVLVGYDDMGTPDFYYDDVVILGDSSDNVDHYRDGFNTLPAHVMLGTWFNGGATTCQAYVHFGRKA